MITLPLKEEIPGIFSGQELDHQTAKTLHEQHGDKISVDYNPWDNTYSLQSRGYVGYIPINEKYTLKIEPKVEVNNVFRMLEYAYKLKSFELLKGTTDIESIEDFFERFVNILAKRVLDRNRKGLYCDYVERSDVLPCLKGRPKMLPTTVSILRGALNPTCLFEEHTSDLPENQILLWTLYQLRYFPIKRADVKCVVQKAFRELIYKANLTPSNPKDCINRFYNRLNQDYKPLHGLCRFFLEHVGPAIKPGNYQFIPFVINMPRLFECFVAEWLKANLPDNYGIESKYNVFFDEAKEFNFEIDITITDTMSGKTLAVLDTKYKTSEKPLEQDIYQIFTYAATMEAKNAFLIYPSSLATPLNSTRHGITVRNITFDITKDSEQSGKAFITELTNHLKNN